MNNKKADVLDLKMDIVSMHQAVDKIMENVTSRPKKTYFIVTPNTDFLIQAHKNPRLLEILNSADLSVTDGMPLVWLEHVLGYKKAKRVSGVDMADEICKRCSKTGRSIFILGSQDKVTIKAIDILKYKYPSLKIAGYYNPPYRKEFAEIDDKTMLEIIHSANPDILFVAFGLPKGEYWIKDNLKDIRVPVAIDIGGSFEMISGFTPRAPLWMQKAGMEWLFRLVHEPRRLWKRYLLDDIKILFIALSNKQIRELILQKFLPFIKIYSKVNRK